MNNSAEKILYRKAALIFEELGFLMPRSDNGEISNSSSTSAMVAFRGPFSGCLLVSLSLRMLPQLAANMLGEETASNASLEQDSLGEIANVICGNALPAIYGFDSIFHLDAPVLIEEPDSVIHCPEYKKEGQVNISFDSGQAMLALLIKADQSVSAAS